jgi:catechol 2,3-dioxygenase
MPAPKHTINPPFNIIRCSHIVLGVKDLAASRAFYADIIGLHVEDESENAIYMRGMEELQHHSLVLKKSTSNAKRLGFRVGDEDDLDKAFAFFTSRGLPASFHTFPYQGRTLHVTDPFGFKLEFTCSIERRPSLLRDYKLYKGVQPQRLDHFNVMAPEVQQSVDFYAELGFRLTEYAEEEPEDGGRIAAAWMHRKGNVHDMAFTNGKGPRLHHFCYWSPSPLHIIHLCDVMATAGYLENMERGPGRHGISNAFFLYVRDPDGHRLEIYSSDYQTMDPDHPPLRWSLRDPRRQTLWGSPAPKSWFEEGSEFGNTELREAAFKANVIVAS